ncbi:MAG: hypothetical protein KKB70_05910, partial [Proteobacteria bacterium]|nr:hypothetical protein [Pseudomonadota bacterium]
VHVGMEDNGNTPHEHGSFVKRCCVSLRSVNRKFPDTLVHTLTTFIMSFLSCFVVGRYENTVMVLVQIALLVAAVTLSYVRWVHSRGLRVQ